MSEIIIGVRVSNKKALLLGLEAEVILLVKDHVVVVCSTTFQLMNLARLNYERGSSAPSLVALYSMQPKEQEVGKAVRIFFTAVAAHMQSFHR